MKALASQVQYWMRDGTHCACPAGENECEPRGRMPTEHSTSCLVLREAMCWITIGTDVWRRR